MERTPTTHTGHRGLWIAAGLVALVIVIALLAMFGGSGGGGGAGY
jgi:uncharacterized membrane protein